MRKISIWGAAIGLLALTACGGSNGSPSQAVPPAPSVSDSAQATPVRSASATSAPAPTRRPTAAPTPPPTPTPAPAVQLHPAGMRTGVKTVDAFVEALAGC